MGRPAWELMGPEDVVGVDLREEGVRQGPGRTGDLRGGRSISAVSTLYKSLRF